MKAFVRAVVLCLVLASHASADPAVEEELRRYDELSRSLHARVGKLERNARSCYKNMSTGYQAMVQAKGVFGMFESGKAALESNRVAVKQSFTQLFADLGKKPDTSSTNACLGGAATAASSLAGNGASVAAAKARLAALEPDLLKTQRSLSSPGDRANIEYLVDCGDPTAVRNFHAALDEYNRLVKSHGALALYLQQQEAALASGAQANAANGRLCGELAKAK